MNVIVKMVTSILFAIMIVLAGLGVASAATEKQTKCEKHYLVIEVCKTQMVWAWEK